MASTPQLPSDFVDLLAAFADAEVRYLVIGGYAVGFHDRPRATKDLDLLLADDADNVERACRREQLPLSKLGKGEARYFFSHQRRQIAR